MARYTLRREACRCERCDHRWFPILERPNICPKCKSKAWNKPKEKRDDRR